MKSLIRIHAFLLFTVFALLSWTTPGPLAFRNGAQNTSPALAFSTMPPNTVLVDDAAENRTFQYNYTDSERYYRDLPEWLDRYSFLPAPNEVPDDQRVCLVHVGKTAGITLSCLLGFKVTKCDQKMTLLPGKLPQYTTNMVHVARNSCERERIGLYLFTLRNPLHRLLSWFAYEKPYSPDSRSSRNKRRFNKVKPLYIDCGFDTMNQLGEAMSSNRTHSVTKKCYQRAWQAVTGRKGFAYHNHLNYGYYWNQIPGAARRSARMAVVRTEHLEQDWYSVERLLGTADNNIQIETTKTKPAVFGIKNQSVKNDTDAVLSEVARHNLCAGLCEEIQIYKRILYRAENLSPEDLAVSLTELAETCPVQAAMAVDGGCLRIKL